MKQPRPRLMASQKMAIVFLLGFVFAGVMFKLNEKTTMIYPVANKWISTACSSISVSVKTVAQNVEKSYLQKSLVKPKVNKASISSFASKIFTKSYEMRRRAIQREVFEQWEEVRDILKSQNRSHYTDFVYDANRRHFVNSMAKLVKIREMDGFNRQRIGMAKSLGDFVQSKLDENQNPEDCSSARYFVCENTYIENTTIPICNWGCIVLQLMTCFREAFATNRILVANMTFFGLDGYFQPLSNRCKLDKVPDSAPYYPHGDKEKVIRRKLCVSLDKAPPVHWQRMRQPSVPKSLASQLQWISPDPEVWFHGQFLVYLLRPSDNFRPQFERYFREPVPASIHVRRTDKVTSDEAVFLPTSKYMAYVEEHFDILSQSRPRNLYVATDDSSVIDELHRDYPGYKLIANQTAARLTADFNNRYSKQEHWNVLNDFFHLVASDFLVCTLTSNLARLVYKMRTAMKPLVTDLYEVVSLDIDHYEDYGGNYVALHDKKTVQDGTMLSMKKGDIIHRPPPTIQNHLTTYKKNHGAVTYNRAWLARYSRASVMRILETYSEFRSFES